MRTEGLVAILLTASVLVASAHAEPPPATPQEPSGLGALCTLPPPGGAGPRDGRTRSEELLRVAASAYETGRFADSLRALRQAYALAPLPDTLFNMAQACRAADRAEDALLLYTETLRTSQDASLRADAERRTVSLRAKLAQKHAARAQARLAEKDYPGAQSAWQDAYAVSPQPIFQFRIAQALRQDGQTTAALAHYERFLREEPKSELRPEAELAIAQLHGRIENDAAQRDFDAHHYSHAITDWDAAYRWDPDAAYLYARAEAERLAALPRDAIATYQRFLAVAPHTPLHPEVMATLARLQAQLAEADLGASSPPQPAALLPEHAPTTLKPLPRPLYKRWWFWTALGLGAAAAVIVPVVVTQTVGQPTYTDLRMVSFGAAR